MATNTAAPNGLIYVRQLLGSSPTYQANMRMIKKGYATSINIGDLVVTGTGGNQGYVTLATGNESAQLGVFMGITSGQAFGVPGAQGDGYYDQTLQTIVYGLNGAYPSTANPIADIGCRVISDPFAVFRVQMINGSFTQSLVGQNINFAAGTNGVTTGNGSFGQSSLSVDFNTLGTSNTLPFRIEGPWGITGGPQDPTNVNPWLEVRINISEMLASTGI